MGNLQGAGDRARLAARSIYFTYRKMTEKQAEYVARASWGAFSVMGSIWGVLFLAGVVALFLSPEFDYLSFLAVEISAFALCVGPLLLMKIVIRPDSISYRNSFGMTQTLAKIDVGSAEFVIGGGGAFKTWYRLEIRPNNTKLRAISINPFVFSERTVQQVCKFLGERLINKPPMDSW